MKIILVIVMLQLGTGLKLFSQGHEPRAATDFAQLVLSEVNLLRTNPKQYAMLRLKNEYISKTDNGAWRYLNQINAMDSLRISNTLSELASSYARLISFRKTLSHNLDGTPLARAKKVGYTGMVGQNLAASSDDKFNALLVPDSAAVGFVKMLVIDKGVPGEGHRHILTEPRFTEIGIGFYRDADDKLKNYFVQEFGHRFSSGK